MADEQTGAATDAETDARNADQAASGQSTDTQGTGAQAQTAAKTDADIVAIAAKADNPDAVRNALQAERESARAATKRAEDLAAQVKEFEDRDKSDQQKLEERATTAETRATDLEAENLRLRVALEKQLPAELIDRLRGGDKKSMEDDADALLKLVRGNGKPSGDVDAGRGESGSGSPSFNDLMREKVRA